MVLILDTYFTHRSRTTEGKDSNPLNEVRVLCNSILENKSVLRADKSIKLKPETSVLKLPPRSVRGLSLSHRRHLSCWKQISRVTSVWRRPWN
jgi:hypothetical protein